ncbi:MAG: lysoplasmalogenase [Mycobacterium sp.]
MGSRAGFSATAAGGSSVTGIDPPYASRATRTLWGAAVVVGAAYGVFLLVTALRSPVGGELTGQFAGQPAVKAMTAVLLAVAAFGHRVRRERRWLVAALALSAAGDFLLAMPWWQPSFVLGLGAFLVAHLCFLAALLPLATRTPFGLAAAVVVCVACTSLLTWFWPQLIAEGMAVPVVLYMVVLAAMVCTALLATLPTPWTAIGAVCFAVSDAMIGIGKFVLPAGAGLPATSGSEALAVPIWWAYATSLLLITAGLFFGRGSANVSEHSATPPA